MVKSQQFIGCSVKSDEQAMEYALALAQQAYDVMEVPVGAVVVHEGLIIGEGFNQPIGLHDPSAHAEVLAIRQAAQHVQNYRLVNCSLFVTLEPCTMCTGLLIHSRLARLVYGATEPKAGAIQSAIRLPEHSFYNHCLNIQGGVLAEACSQILSDFFAMRRQQQKSHRKGWLSDGKSAN